ncbi:hypothetical protein NO2_0089 [Candidatus Termititenax persephonae]|uniref:Uncharacterized protein n=1 Tax=Candidatus Termititenax persephonae TaxID=2218525 RepID=A0A388TEE5_9BACT|nr:hypothetical protein NO2_0089 [Candidatus Termititenax persephonae]
MNVMSKLNAREYRVSEQMKRCSAEGMEYGFARELATALGYAKWENFARVIDRAMLV